MGAIGTIIVIVLSAGATYYLTAQSGRGPVSLTPDVQRYVDARLSGSSSAEQELQGLTTRLAQIEAKVAEIEKIKASHEKLAGKSEVIEAAISDQRRRKEEVVASARTNELARLRNEIATACAGVTIRSAAPVRGAPPVKGQRGKAP